MMSEWRRKHRRISCFIPILIRPTGSKYDEGWGIIQDIGLGGVKLESRLPLNDGQTVFVSFMVSDNFNFVNTKGIVKRIIKSGIYYIYGIQFVELIDRQHLLNALQEYLASSS